MSKKLKMMEFALKHYGLREVVNGITSQSVLAIINDVSEIRHKTNVPWCAAFVGYVLKNNDYQYSVTLNARSYLKVGKPIIKPTFGCIVVLWRGSQNGWKGHVGFYIGSTGNCIYMLGGNQNNEVCIKAYSKKQLLEYREPAKLSPLAVGARIEEEI